MLFVVSHHVYFYNIVLFVLQRKKNTNMNKNNTETNIVLNQLPQKLQTTCLLCWFILNGLKIKMHMSLKRMEKMNQKMEEEEEVGVSNFWSCIYMTHN